MVTTVVPPSWVRDDWAQAALDKSAMRSRLTDRFIGPSAKDKETIARINAAATGIYALLHAVPHFIYTGGYGLRPR
jgi:hypothetical protein